MQLARPCQRSQVDMDYNGLYTPGARTSQLPLVRRDIDSWTCTVKDGLRSREQTGRLSVLLVGQRRRGRHWQ
jgi:hypothetical protein